MCDGGQLASRSSSCSTARRIQLVRQQDPQGEHGAGLPGLGRLLVPGARLVQLLRRSDVLPRQVLIEAPLEVFALAHEGQVGEHHRLQPGDGLVADQASAQRAFEMPALAGEREDEAGGEA